MIARRPVSLRAVTPSPSFLPLKKLDLEEIAAEFLTEEAEAVYGDRGEWLDEFSDAALADRLVTEGRDQFGKLDFERLVAAFAKVRSE